MITYDSFNKVACATHQDVGETSKTVESGKKLVCGLRGTVSNEHGNARSLTSYKHARKSNGFIDVRADRKHSLEGHRCIRHCWIHVDEMRRSSQPRQ
jgi:hypothetical protein